MTIYSNLIIVIFMQQPSMDNTSQLKRLDDVLGIKFLEKNEVKEINVL